MSNVFVSSRSAAVRQRASASVAPLVGLVLAQAFALALVSAAAAVEQYEYDAAGRLRQVAHDNGNVTTYVYDGDDNVLAVVVSTGPVGVGDGVASPQEFALGPAYPNPGPRPRFGFSLPREAQVTVRIFDPAGRLVATAVDDRFGSGRHTVELSVASWPAGLYLYRLETPGFAQTRRLVVLR